MPIIYARRARTPVYPRRPGATPSLIYARPDAIPTNPSPPGATPTYSPGQPNDVDLVLKNRRSTAADPHGCRILVRSGLLPGRRIHLNHLYGQGNRGSLPAGADHQRSRASQTDLVVAEYAGAGPRYTPRRCGCVPR